MAECEQACTTANRFDIACAVPGGTPAAASLSIFGFDLGVVIADVRRRDRGDQEKNIGQGIWDLRRVVGTHVNAVAAMKAMAIVSSIESNS